MFDEQCYGSCGVSVVVVGVVGNDVMIVIFTCQLLISGNGTDDLIIPEQLPPKTQINSTQQQLQQQQPQQQK